MVKSKIACRSVVAASFLLWIGVVSAFSAAGQEPTSAESNKLDEGILDSGQAGLVPIFVRMEDQLFPHGGDYERFCDEQPKDVNRLELRGGVIKTLKEKSDRSRKLLQKKLADLEKAGQLRGVQHYWIVNGFAGEATIDACRELANREEVNFIYRERHRLQLRQSTPKRRPTPQPELAKYYRELLGKGNDDTDQPFTAEGFEIPWNLKRIRADKAWAKHGVTGKGVVVAVIDDGMMAASALLPALWINAHEELNGKDDDGNGYVDDVFGYHFNKQSPFTLVRSGARHGTLCAGIVAARPVGDEKKIATGVAPRAKIMLLIGSGRLSAYEYALEQGADVVSMSFTFEPTEMGNYRGLLRAAHEHLAAAGIVSVGGAGNYGNRWPLGKQIGSPKDIPCVIAAAGVRADGEVAPASSRGPVSWKGIATTVPNKRMAKQGINQMLRLATVATRCGRVEKYGPADERIDSKKSFLKIKRVTCWQLDRKVILFPVLTLPELLR